MRPEDNSRGFGQGGSQTFWDSSWGERKLILTERDTPTPEQRSGFALTECIVRVLCTDMATKTISITEEAYERLRARRRDAADSFSRIILRAKWDEEGVTAGELLDRWVDAPRFYSDAELDQLAEWKKAGAAPEDKWSRD